MSDDVSFVDLPKYRVNPFLDTVQLSARRQEKKATGTRKMKTVDGEEVEVVLDGQEFKVTDTVPVDEEEFVKLFRDTIRKLYGLSQPALRVLNYVLDQVEGNRDIFAYNPTECLEKVGFKSKQSVYQGLCELCKKGFIARAKKKGFLYINPAFIFNGDRVTLVKRFQKRVNNARKAAGI